MQHFKPKLRAMVDTALGEGSTLGLRNFRRIGQTLTSLLSGAAWGEPTKSERNELDNALSEIKDSARLIDAAICLQERVFDTDNGFVTDIPLKRDLRKAQDEINERFENGDA